MSRILPLVILVLMLAGCGWGWIAGGTPPVEPGQSASPEIPEVALPSSEATTSPLSTQTPGIAAPIPTAMPTEGVSLQTEGNPALLDEPDEEAVLAAYRRAAEAWRWFHGDSMPFDPEDTRTVGEVTYCRVNHSGFTDLGSLQGYLKGLFSDELVDSLLHSAGNQIVELDGVLYVRPTVWENDGTRGAETRQVLYDIPGRLLVQVTVERLDPDRKFAVTGRETYEFPYQKVGENWIFTDFSLIR